MICPFLCASRILSYTMIIYVFLWGPSALLLGPLILWFLPTPLWLTHLVSVKKVFFSVDPNPSYLIPPLLWTDHVILTLSLLFYFGISSNFQSSSTLHRYIKRLCVMCCVWDSSSSLYYQVKTIRCPVSIRNWERQRDSRFRSLLTFPSN